MVIAERTAIYELRNLERRGKVKLLSPRDLDNSGSTVVTSGSSPIPNLRAVEPADVVWQAMHLSREGVDRKMTVHVGGGGSLKAALNAELNSANQIGLDTQPFLEAVTSRVDPEVLEKYVQSVRINPNSLHDILLIPAHNFAAPTPETSQYISEPNAKRLYKETLEEIEPDQTFVRFSLALRQKATEALAAKVGLPHMQSEALLIEEQTDAELTINQLARMVGSNQKALVSFHCLDCGHMNRGEVIKHFLVGDNSVRREGNKIMSCRHSRAFSTELNNGLTDNGQRAARIVDLLRRGSFFSGLGYYMVLINQIASPDVLQLRDYSQGRGTYTHLFETARTPIEVLPTRRLYLGKTGEEHKGYLSALLLLKMADESNLLNQLETNSPFFDYYSSSEELTISV